MNFRAIINYAGNVLKAEAVFMLIPLVISVYEREFGIAYSFAAAIAIMIVVALLSDLVKRGTQNINNKDGFALVAICWIILSVFGALPYYFSGQFPSYIDCLFDSVSGFTTTSASALPDISHLNKGILFWRCFSNWIGGMGILVFLLAIVPNASGENTINVMKAESPGPAPGKLVPNLRKSSEILYYIYIGLTIAQTALYLLGGMPVFDSVCNAFATAGTGGFSITAPSIGYYNSLYAEAVTTVFMILYGVNFNIYYFLIIRNIKSVIHSEEFRAYIGIIVASVALITINLAGSVYDTMPVALRHASFNVASIITTTGFTTVDFNLWPEFSKMILLTLMFTGACAGSTSGGVKISRILIALKESRRILFRISHPRSFEVIKMDGKVMDKTVVHGVTAYTITLTLIFLLSALILSIDNFDFTTSFTAIAACINNIGPGFGLVGPTGNYSIFSPLSKLVLIFDMLIGRLEIYPMLLLFAPHTWRKM